MYVVVVLCYPCALSLVQSLVKEVTKLREQLQSSEEEKEMYRQQLMRKKAELTRAEETIRGHQQQVRHMVWIHTCKYVSGLPWDFLFLTTNPMGDTYMYLY